MNVYILPILRASQMAKTPVRCWESRGECSQTRLQSIGWYADHFLDRIDANSDSLRSRHLYAHSDQQILKYEPNLRIVVWFRYESGLSSSVMRDGWMERMFIAESHWSRTERIDNAWWDGMCWHGSQWFENMVGLQRYTRLSTINRTRSECTGICLMKLINHFHRYDSLLELYRPNDKESDFESNEWVRGS